jgi:hypothetical protein
MKLPILVVFILFGARLFGQSITPNIHWLDSFKLPKDDYFFHKVSRSDSGTHIEAEGKKHYYSFLVQDGKLIREMHPKAKREYWLYQGQGAYGLRFIARKHVEKNIHQIFLKEENAKEIGVFTFKENPERPSTIEIIESDSIVHVILLPSGKFNDSAQIMHAAITPRGEISRHYYALGELSRLTEITQVHFKSDQAEFLIKSYRINKIEKRGFNRNYQCKIIRIELSNAESSSFQIPLIDSFFYPKIKYAPELNEIYGVYGLNTGNKALGMFIVNLIDTTIIHYPFDKQTVLRSKKKIEPWKRNSIYSLHPDMVLKQGENHLYFFEQYFVKLVGGPAENPIFNFNYNHVIVANKSVTGQVVFNVIPKYQKTFNDQGQISSYQVLNGKNSSYVVFNSGLKYQKHPYRTYGSQELKYLYALSLNQIDINKVMQIDHNPLLSALMIFEGKGQYRVFSYRKRMLRTGLLQLNPISP